MSNSSNIYYDETCKYTFGKTLEHKSKKKPFMDPYVWHIQIEIFIDDLTKSFTDRVVTVTYIQGHEDGETIVNYYLEK